MTSLRSSLRRFGLRLAVRADRIEFANLADDIHNRVSPDYSVYVDSNEQRIVVTRKVVS